MYLRIVKYVLLLTILNVSINLYSQSSVGFIPNRNQWQNNVIYKTDLKGGAMFLEKDGFTFRFVESIENYHKHKSNGNYEEFAGKLKTHAYKLEFLNANKSSKISSENPSKMTYNFFCGQDKSKWASGLKKYSQVKYSGLYGGIDMKCQQTIDEMKYEFVVNPHANYKDILIKISGADRLYLKDKNLYIVTSLGEVSEKKPFVYQKVNGKISEVNSEFILKDNILSFQIGEYNVNDTLIIDPTLVFSTYSGSTADNWGFTATYDYKGNVYSGGIVQGIGFPDTLGPSLMDFAGGAEVPNSGLYSYGWDIGIIKYDSIGNGIFATYLGGNSSEMPHSLIVNEFNQLIIFGTTGSTNFPVTDKAFDKTFNGGTFVNYDDVVWFYEGIDIFVTRISEDGSDILASTYVGGTSNDGLNFANGDPGLKYNYGDGARGELITDDLNNIYIGSCTYSSDFPQGLGAGFQPSYKAKRDGIVFKMDFNLTNVVWSSYLGGDGDDAVYSIDVDSKYDVYVTGGTSSNNFPVTANAYQNVNNGGAADAFVSHISRNGETLLGSTMFGLANYDQAFCVRTDRHDNVYIAGQTENSGGALIYNAQYSVPNSGQFITKFTNNLDSIIWSTEFGTGDGVPVLSPTAFAVDICNRVYFSGWGNREHSNNGTSGFQTTPDALYSTTDGQDFYIMVLLDDASMLDYATFFGEFGGIYDHVDGGTSRFDKNGNIYQSVCASCGGNQGFPTTPGVWSETNNADNCNNALFKINIHYDFADADFNYQNAGVAPFNATFINTGSGTSFIWDFGDSSAVSTEENPQHLYTSAGVYNVTLIANDPTSCNISDTIVKQLVVMSDTVIYLDDIYICNGEFAQIGIDPISDTAISYIWSPTETLSDFTVSNPFTFTTVTTQYMMLMTNGIVVDTFFQKVIVVDNLTFVDAGNDTSICPNDTIVLTALSSIQNKFIWSTNLQFSDIINYNFQNFARVSPGSDKYYYVKSFDTLCNYFSIDSILVKLSIPKIELNNQKICSSDTVSINVVNLNPSDQLSYLWAPASIIISENNEQVTVSCTEDTTLYVSYTNQFGCSGKDSISITISEFYIDSIITDKSCFNSCSGKANVILSVGVEPFQYLWSNGETSSEADSLCEGLINVTVTDSLQCVAYKSSLITSSSEINVSSSTIDATCESNCNGKATITVLNGIEPITFFIDNNQVNNEISNLCEGIYILKIIDSLHCILFDTLIIKLNTNDIAMPNIITPNNDGINDYLLIENECNYQIEFTVFSRWGAIVYNSNSEVVQWGGYTNSGVLVSPGVYYYIIKSPEGGDKYSKAGYIHVIH